MNSRFFKHELIMNKDRKVLPKVNEPISKDIKRLYVIALCYIICLMYNQSL